MEIIIIKYFGMFKIFDKLGGIEPTPVVIGRRRGMCPSRRVVLDWPTRRSIPPVNTIPLMLECQERGIRFKISDCLLAAKPPIDKGLARSRGKGLARLKG